MSAKTNPANIVDVIELVHDLDHTKARQMANKIEENAKSDPKLRGILTKGFGHGGLRLYRNGVVSGQVVNSLYLAKLTKHLADITTIDNASDSDTPHRQEHRDPSVFQFHYLDLKG